MVLICGYGAVAPTDLPHYGAIEYVIKPAQRDIKMLRRTKMLAKCSEVCLPQEYVELIPVEYAEKLYICETLDALKEHLRAPNKVEETQENVSTAPIKRPKRQVARKAVKAVQTNEAPDVCGVVSTSVVPVANNTETETQVLQEAVQTLEIEVQQLKSTIQQLEDDKHTLSANTELLENEVTELQQALTQKESVNADLNVQLQQMEQELNAYTQDTDKEDLRTQLDETQYVADMYKGEIDELRSNLDVLTETLETERKQYESDKEQYAEMIEQYEAERKTSALTDILTAYMLQEQITPQLNVDTTNIYTVCFAEENPAVYDDIRSTITAGGLNAVIADFSGNRCLSARLKIAAQKGVKSLANGASVEEVVVLRGKTQIIPSEPIQDVQLLTYDWCDIVTRLNNYAQGRPVYILLGSISSFSTQYVMSLLAQTQPAYLIGRAVPDSLLNLYWRLQAIPPARLKLVLTEYVPGTLKSLLDAMVAHFSVSFVNKGTQLHIESLHTQQKRDE